MNILEVIKQNQAYCSAHTDMPANLKHEAQMICWEYNQTSPKETDRRAALLKTLLGDCHPLTFIIA